MKGLLVTVGGILLVCWGLLRVGAGVSENARQEQLGFMEQALLRGAVQCYAIEGRFPKGLEELCARTGLVLDENAYLYHYQSMGGNLLPEIRVFEKGAAE